MYEKKNKKKNIKYRNLKKLRNQETNVISSNLTLSKDITSNHKIINKIKYVKYTIDNFLNNIQNKYCVYKIFMINYKIFFLNLKFSIYKKTYLFSDQKFGSKFCMYLNSDNKKEDSNNFIFENDKDKSYLRIYCKNNISINYNSLFDQMKYRIKIGFYSNNQLENEILKYFDHKILTKKYHNQVEWLIT